VGVRKRLAERTNGQRIVALLAAYAVALSSLIASFVAANAAAAEAAGAPGAICHTSVSGEAAPLRSTDESNGKLCPFSCCIGCHLLMAAVPKPPVATVAAAAAPGRALESQGEAVLVGRPEAKSHRPRGPPGTA
jgi:hypothetical protein